MFTDLVEARGFLVSLVLAVTALRYFLAALASRAVISWADVSRFAEPGAESVMVNDDMIRTVVRERRVRVLATGLSMLLAAAWFAVSNAFGETSWASGTVLIAMSAYTVILIPVTGQHGPGRRNYAIVAVIALMLGVALVVPAVLASVHGQGGPVGRAVLTTDDVTFPVLNRILAVTAIWGVLRSEIAIEPGGGFVYRPRESAKKKEREERRDKARAAAVSPGEAVAPAKAVAPPAEAGTPEASEPASAGEVRLPRAGCWVIAIPLAIAWAVSGKPGSLYEPFVVLVRTVFHLV
jgi:hypothetical protein